MRQVSPQKWIFKELQDIGNMEFRFAEEQPQDDYAAELAGFILFTQLISLNINFVVQNIGKDSNYNYYYFMKLLSSLYVVLIIFGQRGTRSISRLTAP